MVTAAEGKFLVRLARSAIECALEGKKLPPAGDFPKAGAFVTLLTKPARELRGCIGFPEPIMPLGQAVAEAAVCAALNDPRFSQLSKEELKKIIVEVSVLSELEPLKKPPKSYLKQVAIGKHGLVIELGGRRGLLLPQVPVEFKWGKDEFLCHLCNKAGLPADAWMDEKAKLWRFTTQIFDEKFEKK